MTRIFHWPPSSTVSSAGSVDSSLPGQNGHGRSAVMTSSFSRGAKSFGRWARSETMVTHLPFSGFNRICLTMTSGYDDCACK